MDLKCLVKIKKTKKTKGKKNKMTLFTLTLLVLLIMILGFGIKWNISASRELKKDRTMFKMAKLRGEVINHLLNKYKKLSKVDIEASTELVRMTSYIISNHNAFYASRKFSHIINYIQVQKEEVEEAKQFIAQTHNKTIKGFYTKMGTILLKNISEYINFVIVRLVFTILGALMTVLGLTVHLKFLKALKRKDAQYGELKVWHEQMNKIFSKNNEKYCGA